MSTLFAKCKGVCEGDSHPTCPSTRGRGVQFVFASKRVNRCIHGGMRPTALGVAIRYNRRTGLF